MTVTISKKFNILEIAQKIFQMDQKIYAIGGPDVSPEGQLKKKINCSN